MNFSFRILGNDHTGCSSPKWQVTCGFLFLLKWQGTYSCCSLNIPLATYWSSASPLIKTGVQETLLWVGWFKQKPFWTLERNLIGLSLMNKHGFICSEFLGLFWFLNSSSLGHWNVKRYWVVCLGSLWALAYSKYEFCPTKVSLYTNLPLWSSANKPF